MSADTERIGPPPAPMTEEENAKFWAEETVSALRGKAIPERMDGAEAALAGFKMETNREIKALKNRLENRYKEPTAEEVAKEEAEERRYRERAAWVQFAVGGLSNDQWKLEKCALKADDMLDEYRKRWEADNV